MEIDEKTLFVVYQVLDAAIQDKEWKIVLTHNQMRRLIALHERIADEYSQD